VTRNFGSFVAGAVQGWPLARLGIIFPSNLGAGTVLAGPPTSRPVDSSIASPREPTSTLGLCGPYSPTMQCSSKLLQDGAADPHCPLVSAHDHSPSR